MTVTSDRGISCCRTASTRLSCCLFDFLSWASPLSCLCFIICSWVFEDGGSVMIFAMPIYTECTFERLRLQTQVLYFKAFLPHSNDIKFRFFWVKEILKYEDSMKESTVNAEFTSVKLTPDQCLSKHPLLLDLAALTIRFIVVFLTSVKDLPNDL